MSAPLGQKRQVCCKVYDEMLDFTSSVEWIATIVYSRQKQLHASIAHGGGAEMFDGWMFLRYNFDMSLTIKRQIKNKNFCPIIENPLHKSVPHIAIYCVHTAINHPGQFL